MLSAFFRSAAFAALFSGSLALAGAAAAGSIQPPGEPATAQQNQGPAITLPLAENNPDYVNRWGLAPGWTSWVDIGTTGDDCDGDVRHFGIWASADGGATGFAGMGIDRDNPSNWGYGGRTTGSLPSQGIYYDGGRATGFRHSDGEYFESGVYATFNPWSKNLSVTLNGFYTGSFNLGHSITMSRTMPDNGNYYDPPGGNQDFGAFFIGHAHNGVMGYMKDLDQDLAGAIYMTWKYF